MLQVRHHTSPHGHAAFKFVLKLVLFSKTLEGCYSASNGPAVFKLGQLTSFSSYIFLPWFLFHIGKG